MYTYFILYPLYMTNILLVLIQITSRQRDLVESSELAQQLMFLYHIFSPHYIFLWPEDGPQWLKHVIILINRIQRQLCFDVPTPFWFPYTILLIESHIFLSIYLPKVILHFHLSLLGASMHFIDDHRPYRPFI